MGSIEIYSQNDPGHPQIHTLEVKGNDDSFLSYTWSAENFAWYISIHTDPQRQGLGKALAQKFIQTLGPNQPIYGLISHEPSLEFIRDNQYHHLAMYKQIELDQQLMAKIPLVMFMRKSGLSIAQVKLEYYPLGHLHKLYSDVEIEALHPTLRKYVLESDSIVMEFYGNT